MTAAQRLMFEEGTTFEHLLVALILSQSYAKIKIKIKEVKRVR